jgi:LysR family transcriptional activator of glutamate synthase operon
MELRQLHYFVSVARKQHVTHAAEELHVAQSAVSRQIHLLEEELELNLFVQKGRNLQLTPVGKLFLNRIERILAD